MKFLKPLFLGKLAMTAILLDALVASVVLVSEYYLLCL